MADSQSLSGGPILAVVFDMDGLMFNTEDLYDQVGQAILERRGRNYTRELKLKMMGLPGPQAFEVMREACGLEDSVDDLQSECDREFADLLPREIRCQAGLETVLDHVEALRLPKAIATSSHRQFAEQALSCFELGPRFEFVLTAADVPRGKPHPDIYLEACRRLGAAPDQTLVFEDSWHGSQAASAAGTYLVAIPTHHTAHLDFSHAQLQAERLDDPRILNRLGPTPGDD